MANPATPSTSRWRDHAIKLRCTAEERAAFHQQAAAKGISLADAVRLGLVQVLFDGDATPLKREEGTV